jgi:hypothetical protein
VKITSIQICMAQTVTLITSCRLIEELLVTPGAD